MAKKTKVVPVANQNEKLKSGTTGSSKIASIHNPEKLELVEVEIKIGDGSRWQIEALPDTGANNTAFQPEILKKLGLSNKDMKKAPRILKSAYGSALRTLWSVDVRISKSGHTTVFMTAYIIKNLQQLILSRQVLWELGIIPQEFPFVQLSISNRTNQKTRGRAQTSSSKISVCATSTLQIKFGNGPEHNKFAKEFPEVFDNTKILTMNGGLYMNELKETAIPFNKGPSCTILEPCMEKLKKELELQLGLGLIKQDSAGKKSECLHLIVIAPKKDGSIRFCIDLRMLNKFVKFENPQRSPSEVVCMIPTGCKHSAMFNAFKGYHEVEPESRKQTTFHTPFVQYHYLHLSMGLSSAGDAQSVQWGTATGLTTGLNAEGELRTHWSMDTHQRSLPRRQKILFPHAQRLE